MDGCRRVSLALLGANSVARRGEGGSDGTDIGQELQYALYHGPDRLRGKGVAGQLVTRRFR
jgi:hypothetical protein